MPELRDTFGQLDTSAGMIGGVGLPLKPPTPTTPSNGLSSSTPCQWTWVGSVVRLMTQMLVGSPLWSTRVELGESTESGAGVWAPSWRT